MFFFFLWARRQETAQFSVCDGCLGPVHDLRGCLLKGFAAAESVVIACCGAHDMHTLFVYSFLDGSRIQR